MNDQNMFKILEPLFITGDDVITPMWLHFSKKADWEKSVSDTRAMSCELFKDFTTEERSIVEEAYQIFADAESEPDYQALTIPKSVIAKMVGTTIRISGREDYDNFIGMLRNIPGEVEQTDEHQEREKKMFYTHMFIPAMLFAIGVGDL